MRALLATPAAPLRLRAAGRASAHRRASRHVVRAANADGYTGGGIALAEDGRRARSSGCFEQDFEIALGGETPAPVTAKFEPGSEAVIVTIPRPLGIAFEEKTVGIYTQIVVDEVVEGSNAAKADVKVGDILRITTAVFNVPGVIDVTAWLNPPKSTNCKAFYVCDQKPFDKVMDAIKSHAVPVDTPDGPVEIMEVGLVLERPASAA